MTKRSGPIYEVTFFVDRDIIGEFDRWLENHVREACRVDSVAGCDACATGDDEDGRPRRLCLYRLDDNDSLDSFLEGFGGDIDNAVADSFGDRVAMSARVLREDVREDVTGGSPDCLNCGAYLRGQYCAVCGQRASSRLISLWGLIADAFGDLFELDSRLWQTLVPLLVRPGRLTDDYLKGRRARYMPPFRMYLVLSLLFFIVAFFDPRENFSLLFEATPQTEAVDQDTTDERADANAGELDARRQEAQAVLDELVTAGKLDPEDVPKLDDDFNLRIGDGGVHTNADCDVDQSDIEDLPGWLQRRLTVERLKHICEKTQIDDGRAFIDKLLDNVPAALIVLLPLMAFVLKLLYPLSRRYYVEHLLFFVHFHAFFFLILTLQILWVRLSTWVQIPEALAILTVVISSFYIPIYLFVAMRRVYGQGRFVTFLKYIALVTTYALGFSLTMLGAVALAALSI